MTARVKHSFHHARPIYGGLVNDWIPSGGFNIKFNRFLKKDWNERFHYRCIDGSEMRVNYKICDKQRFGDKLAPLMYPLCSGYIFTHRSKHSTQMRVATRVRSSYFSKARILWACWVGGSSKLAFLITSSTFWCSLESPGSWASQRPSPLRLSFTSYQEWKATAYRLY